MELSEETLVTCYAEVIVAALPHPLTYQYPSELNITVGSLVVVPLRGKPKEGVVLAVHTTPPSFITESILEKKQFTMRQPLVDLARHISIYYCCSLYKVLALFLPKKQSTEPKTQLFVQTKLSKKKLIETARQLRSRFPSQAQILDAFLQEEAGYFIQDLIKRLSISRSSIDALVKKEILEISCREVIDSVLEGVTLLPSIPKVLNQEQQEITDQIQKEIAAHHHAVHLLFGVTGSGKTEIYLRLIEETLAYGKGVIVLVPEICLTFQTIHQIKSRLRIPIGVLHSQLSDTDRAHVFEQIDQGILSVVIGARSSVFAPIHNLGLIIVDEEHDPSYKQTEKPPCYHARDVAIMRGWYEQAVVVLGSATPSLESFYKASLGKYRLHCLHQRATAQAPSISLINMFALKQQLGRFTLFAPQLLEKIKERYEKGEQSILFLNRRGYNTAVVCSLCLNSLHCSHCDITLTYHKGSHSCQCHVCNYTIPFPKQCPQCQGTCLQHKGFGTEQIEYRLKAIFPFMTIMRIDRDTTSKKGAHERLLHQFRTLKGDVLIGTQMITKGLHFPQVTLVGILNPDGGLLLPDFRASEYLFSQMIQTSGRAGRGFSPGEVLIQTYHPEHPLFSFIHHQSYTEFYEQEIISRKTFEFPPFLHLVKIQFAGSDASEVLEYAESFRSALIPNLNKKTLVMPIIASVCERRKDLHHFQFLIKGPSVPPITKPVYQLLHRHPFPRSLKCLVDVDPTSTFF